MSERSRSSDWPLSPERMADVLECLPAGLVVVDEDGRITYCNRLGDAIREVGERAGEPVANYHSRLSQLGRMASGWRTTPTTR